MPGTSHWLVAGLAQAALTIAAPTIAHADCASDIDKVEAALARAGANDIDETTAQTMLRLVAEATEERRKGDEAKCQELIDQAKYMGNVEE